jgi:Rho GTPase-activating protein 22/24/25
MQCSYDSKGNSVPTILLLMQERLYSQRRTKGKYKIYDMSVFQIM